MVLEHLFLGELLRSLWGQGVRHAEVLKAAVDDSGYDTVIECRRVVRYLQLKSSLATGAASFQNVSLTLLAKPGAAVVWMLVHEDLSFSGFWF